MVEDLCQNPGVEHFGRLATGDSSCLRRPLWRRQTGSRKQRPRTHYNACSRLGLRDYQLSVTHRFCGRGSFHRIGFCVEHLLPLRELGWKHAEDRQCSIAAGEIADHCESRVGAQAFVPPLSASGLLREHVRSVIPTTSRKLGSCSPGEGLRRGDLRRCAMRQRGGRKAAGGVRARIAAAGVVGSTSRVHGVWR